MKNIAIIVILSAALGAPSMGQVIQAHLTPPPCSGHHCLTHPHGAIMPGVDPAHRAMCPHGTVYNAQRGTCKVLATH